MGDGKEYAPQERRQFHQLDHFQISHPYLLVKVSESHMVMSSLFQLISHSLVFHLLPQRFVKNELRPVKFPGSMLRRSEKFVEPLKMFQTKPGKFFGHSRGNWGHAPPEKF